MIRSFIYISCALAASFALTEFRLKAETQRTFYVSPSGDDANDGGTPAHPFATLTKARDAARLINSVMTGDILVLIAKGDYPVSDTIAFTDQDSGTNGHRVIYRNRDGIGSVRFIGGTRASKWSRYKDNIYQADVGAGLGFTTLYEDGIRADRARAGPNEHLPSQPHAPNT